MIKILLGNALFAGCVAAWFVYAEWERSLMLAGTILAFGCFLSGIFMGYLLRGPGKRRRVVYGVSGQAGDADPVMTDNGEQEETESEYVPDEPEVVIEPERVEVPEVPVAAVAVPVTFVPPVAEPVIPVAVHAEPVTPLEPAPVAERVEILFQNIVTIPAKGAALPDPQVPLPVHIHEPEAKVVVDSDGGYEMVVQSEPAPVIPDEQKK